MKKNIPLHQGAHPYIGILCLFIITGLSFCAESWVPIQTLEILDFQPTEINASESHEFEFSTTFSQPMRDTVVWNLAQSGCMDCSALVNLKEINTEAAGFNPDLQWNADYTTCTGTYEVIDVLGNPVPLFAYAGTYSIRTTLGTAHEKGGIYQHTFLHATPVETDFISQKGIFLPDNTVLGEIEVTASEEPWSISGSITHEDQAYAMLYVIPPNATLESNASIGTIIDLAQQTDFSIRVSPYTFASYESVYLFGIATQKRIPTTRMNILPGDKTAFPALFTTLDEEYAETTHELDFAYTVAELTILPKGIATGTLYLYIWEEEHKGAIDNPYCLLSEPIPGRTEIVTFLGINPDHSYYLSAYNHPLSKKELDESCVTLSGGSSGDLGTPIPLNFTDHRTTLTLDFVRSVY